MSRTKNALVEEISALKSRIYLLEADLKDAYEDKIRSKKEILRLTKLLVDMGGEINTYKQMIEDLKQPTQKAMEFLEITHVDNHIQS